MAGGDITVTDGDGDGIRIDPAQNIYLFSGGGIEINAGIEATGAVGLHASGGLEQNGSIYSGGDIHVTGYDITISGDARSADAGDIACQAASSIAVTCIEALSGKVFLCAGESITDTGDNTADIVAPILRMEGGSGIGASDDLLDISVRTIAALADSGGIQLNRVDSGMIPGGLEIGDIGPIVVSIPDPYAGMVVAPPPSPDEFDILSPVSPVAMGESLTGQWTDVLGYDCTWCRF